jgi:hypothetical protein
MFAAGGCVLLLLTSGCATGDAAALTNEPSFASGFGDGCATVREEDKSFSTTRVRDPYLFDSDRAYRAGWRQGYAECGERYVEPDTGGRILGEVRN